MAIPQNPHVHMEDVEKTSVEDEVSDEAGNTGVLCQHGGKQPQRVLVHIGNQHSQQSFGSILLFWLRPEVRAMYFKHSSLLTNIARRDSATVSMLNRGL